MKKVSVLPNGITVCTDAIPHVSSVYLAAIFSRGAMDEFDGKYGVAHVLEHMMFKGTKSRTYVDIANQIADRGASHNATTAADETTYYLRLMHDDTEFGVELLADVLLNSQFPDDELAKEQMVIVQEIQQYADDPMFISQMEAMGRLYEGHALGRSILGNPETVMATTRDDLVEFRRRNYGADTLMFVASGNVQHDEIVRHVQHYFEALGLASSAADRSAPAKLNTNLGTVLTTKAELEQADVTIAYRAFTRRDPMRIPAEVMSYILGGSPTSRLWNEIREKRGLAYSVGADVDLGLTGGTLMIAGGTDPESVIEFCNVAVHEAKRMCSKITDDEIRRATKQLASSFVMGQESTVVRAHLLARQVSLHGRPRTTDEVVAELQSVTAGDIACVAERIFDDGNRVISIVGPPRISAEIGKASSGSS